MIHYHRFVWMVGSRQSKIHGTSLMSILITGVLRPQIGLGRLFTSFCQLTVEIFHSQARFVLMFFLFQLHVHVNPLWVFSSEHKNSVHHLTESFFLVLGTASQSLMLKVDFVKENILELLLDFMYKGYLEVNAVDLQALLNGARMLRWDIFIHYCSLTSALENFLSSCC